VAKILADKEIRKLIGSILINADESKVNPNGVELRLGKHVLFHSTGEEKELGPDLFLKVSPGETVSIASMEQIDFKTSKVQEIFPGCMLMGLITPTTTMMREGISQVATKIDAGFRGNLNWGLRNGSTKDLIVQYGESIFKLTLFLLEGDEAPEMPYGERTADHYQDAQGIVRSARRLPADIPKSKVISSSLEKLDPKLQLREAGYPFNHIGTELTELHGKFELVSTDVRFLKDQFERRTNELSSKIEAETRTLSDKLEESKETLLQRVEALFNRKFGGVIGAIVGSLSILYGGVTYLQGTTFGGSAVAFIATVIGIAILLVTYVLIRRA